MKVYSKQPSIRYIFCIIYNFISIFERSVVEGGKRSNNMNFSVVASNNHIIVDEPLAIFQP